MSEVKKVRYVYNIEEYSQDVRHYQITSNVKLTEDEVRSVYSESDSINNSENYRIEKELESYKGIQDYIDWSDERFTDDEILNKIKVVGFFKGTEYGDDCQVDVFGEFEND